MTEKVRAKKELGQHFLTDGSVLSRIVDLVDIVPGDWVLEVGPGRGALTRLLVAKGAKVVAVELDRQLVPLLREEFAGNSGVEVVQTDILRVDLAEGLLSLWEGRWKVAANLPYNISSQVLFKFLDNCELFSLLVLMLQKEVGDRLVAAPGSKEYGILSVLFRLHYDITREFIVRPGSFHPVPRVDSVVLRFRPLPVPPADVGDEAFFRRVVKAAFSQRRKTLWNCLKSGGLGTDEHVIRQVFERCSLDAGRRGETLSFEEFALLSRSLFAEQPAGKTLE